MTSDAATRVPPDLAHSRSPGETSITGYSHWLEDFERRLALHDDGVAALARDLSTRTPWTVKAEAPGFEAPPARAGRPPDVTCERGAARPPVVFEVELPETLVRRDTVVRLGALLSGAVEARVVLIVDEERHDETIREAMRMLRRAGLEIPVAAISPRSETLTGADW